MRRILIIPMLGFAAVAHAQLFKCDGPEGRSVFSSQPCQPGHGSEIEGTKAAGEQAKRDAAQDAAAARRQFDAQQRALASRPAYRCSATGYVAYSAIGCPATRPVAIPCFVADGSGSCTGTADERVRQQVISRSAACAGARSLQQWDVVQSLCY